MKKYFVTFVNYSSDYNSEEDMERYNLFKKYNSKRNKDYCLKHNYEYIEADEEVFKIPHLFSIPSMPEFEVKNNNHFARWQLFKNFIDNGDLKEGDVIRHHDADVFICDMEKELPYDKNFTYGIDSGNTHCFGAFNLKVGDFANKLIDTMLSKERFDLLTTKKFYKENDGGEVFYYWGDQQAYYIAAGIKCHSWLPFYLMPNYGFHSYVTPYVVFGLDELVNNVDILPVTWNTTHLLGESGGDWNIQNGLRDAYDICHSTRDKTILRHFAGGQKWRFEEYLNYST